MKNRYKIITWLCIILVDIGCSSSTKAGYEIRCIEIDFKRPFIETTYVDIFFEVNNRTEKSLALYTLNTYFEIIMPDSTFIIDRIENEGVDVILPHKKGIFHIRMVLDGKIADISKLPIWREGKMYYMIKNKCYTNYHYKDGVGLSIEELDLDVEKILERGVIVLDSIEISLQNTKYVIDTSFCPPL